MFSLTKPLKQYLFNVTMLFNVLRNLGQCKCLIKMADHFTMLHNVHHKKLGQRQRFMSCRLYCVVGCVSSHLKRPLKDCCLAVLKME